MLARTQIALEPEMHRKARERATQLGISLAEYFRRLVARDLGQPRQRVDPAAIFNLGSSAASDVARDKDVMLGAAVAAERSHPRRGE